MPPELRPIFRWYDPLKNISEPKYFEVIFLKVTFDIKKLRYWRGIMYNNLCRKGQNDRPGKSKNVQV